ncbi:MAG: LysM peptidoglycan-binding domain-containing protein [Bauldia sp.]|uniref:LysM peptidoglycan-binding domain-containing protein n=1 Tax=Bauldia sp. TaxID=2575872 RepID=UPI001D2EB424|nr:LysM peptidoglycan-binding domain-containing protein [Bauldia sp.]MCB1494451.1 LysM peptidoglycan-binding domain-containing protein [Bauldia sp.]
MDARRTTVWIGVIVLLLGIAVLVYFDYGRQDAGTPGSVSTAEEPAMAAATPDEAGAADPSPTEGAPSPAEPALAETDDEKSVVAAAETPAKMAGADVDAPDEEISETVAEAAPDGEPGLAEEAGGEVAEPAPTDLPSMIQEADDNMIAAAPEEMPPPADQAGDVAAAEPGEAAVPAGDAAKEAEAAAPGEPGPDAKVDTKVDAVMPAPDDEPAPPAEVVEAPADVPADEAKDAGAAPESAAAEPQADIVAPSFDVVRVEPTGDAVIAGLAEPGSTVELMSGGDAVATAEANDRGEWALALLEPLTPGPHDLAIRTTSPDKSSVMISDQRVAVMVPESPDEEPLVVLNAPDAPSTVVQLPEAPKETAVADTPAAGPEETVVASVPTEPEEPAAAATPEKAAAEGKPGEPAKETEMAMTDVPAAADGDKAGTGVAEAGPKTDEPSAGPAPEKTEVGAAPEPATTPETTPGAAPEMTPEVAGEKPAEGMAPDVADAAKPGDEPAPAAETRPAEVEMAAVEPEPEPEPEPVIEPEVVVTAVEAETTGALFVAGTATTPEFVRVYMDDKLLGEAKPSPSGTWLLEVSRDLPAGTYSVRADQVTGSGDVVARAEVPFERDVEVAILKPVGQAGGSAGAEIAGAVSGPQTMIIKRRDNLWRISRRLYGKGIRWSTIYQANKDQIRNPRWIYPGQVFVLPEGNAAWEDTEKTDPPG